MEQKDPVGLDQENEMQQLKILLSEKEDEILKRDVMLAKQQDLVIEKDE